MPGAQVQPGARVQSPTCMLQRKDPHAPMKTWCSQIYTNKNYPPLPKGYTQYFWAALHILMEKEMATHSSILAWRIPGTEEPGGLPSLGMHRVGHNWSDLAAAAAADTERTTRWKKLTRMWTPDQSEPVRSLMVLTLLPHHQPIRRMSMNWSCPPLWTITRKLLTSPFMSGHTPLRALTCCGPLCLAKQ